MEKIKPKDFDKEKRIHKYSADDSDDDAEILEESSCGRWLKRKEKVQQRDVPGIDAAYLAMDMEEGMEVVWNEVQFSERRNFKDQEEKLKMVFHNLTSLHHPTIVKFHAYWMDFKLDCPRVVFITEYMAGSFKSFLLTTTKNGATIQLKAWKRWCIQILSALSYLHSCDPPIIHGNLRLGTIFIQHNGLIKIGSVAPDAIHQNIKTCREHQKDHYFLAPEYSSSDSLTTAADIYAFGICALEMTGILEVSGTSENLSSNTEETIKSALEAIVNPLQRDFIEKCIQQDPAKRPTARELLFHPILFEVHPLRLIAAHGVVNNSKTFSDNVAENIVNHKYAVDHVIAHIPFQLPHHSASNAQQHLGGGQGKVIKTRSISFPGGITNAAQHSQDDLSTYDVVGEGDVTPSPRESITTVTSDDTTTSNTPSLKAPPTSRRHKVEFTVSQLPSTLELEKLLEDVKNGFYPLTSFYMAPRGVVGGDPSKSSLPPNNSNHHQQSTNDHKTSSHHHTAPPTKEDTNLATHPSVAPSSHQPPRRPSHEPHQNGVVVREPAATTSKSQCFDPLPPPGNAPKGHVEALDESKQATQLHDTILGSLQDECCSMAEPQHSPLTTLMPLTTTHSTPTPNDPSDPSADGGGGGVTSSLATTTLEDKSGGGDVCNQKQVSKEGILGHEQGEGNNDVNAGMAEEDRETNRIISMTGALVRVHLTPSAPALTTTTTTSSASPNHNNIEENERYALTLHLKMENKINRQLQCDITRNDTFSILVHELITYGFISEFDKEMMITFVQDLMQNNMGNNEEEGASSQQPLPPPPTLPPSTIGTNGVGAPLGCVEQVKEGCVSISGGSSVNGGSKPCSVREDT